MSVEFSLDPTFLSALVILAVSIVLVAVTALATIYIRNNVLAILVMALLVTIIYLRARGEMAEMEGWATYGQWALIGLIIALVFFFGQQWQKKS